MYQRKWGNLACSVAEQKDSQYVLWVLYVYFEQFLWVKCAFSISFRLMHILKLSHQVRTWNSKCFVVVMVSYLWDQIHSWWKNKCMFATLMHCILLKCCVWFSWNHKILWCPQMRMWLKKEQKNTLQRVKKCIWVFQELKTKLSTNIFGKMHDLKCDLNILQFLNDPIERLHLLMSKLLIHRLVCGKTPPGNLCQGWWDGGAAVSTGGASWP